MRGHFLAALTLIATAPVAHALGFGEIDLNSALNQPLQAEIPLLAVKPSERGNLSVQIAEPETFERFGVPRAAVLDDMRVQVVTGERPDRMRVLLSSESPIREPFLTFLLEAEWPEGRAIREYTVLLDPPVSPPAVAGDAAPASPPAEAETAEASPTPTEVERQPSPPREAATTAAAAAERPDPGREPAEASQPPPQPSDSGTSRRRAADVEPESARTYGPVAADETLWSIAYELRAGSSSITMDQTLLAIYLANPQAFDGNMNLMRKGAVLTMPSLEEIRSIDQQVATQEVADQKVAYRRLRQGGEERSRTAAQDTPAGTGTTEASAPGQATEPQAGELRLEPADEDQPQVAAAQTASPEAADEAGDETATQADAQTTDAAEPPSPGTAEPGPQTNGQADAAGTQEAQSAEQPQPPAEDGEQQTQQTAASETASDRTQAPDAESAAAATDPADTTAPGDADGQAAVSEQETAADTAGAPAGGEPLPEESSTAAAEDTTADEPETQAAGEVDTVAVSGGAESVVPESGEALITPRRVLLVLAVLLLVTSLLMWRRNRQYKPVPADFSTAETAAGRPSISPQSAAAATGTAAGLAAGGADGQTYERITVEEALEDADSHIEYELYDEAMGVLNLALEQHPGNAALQRKVLAVYHAAGERDAFVDKADAFFPVQDPDDPDWRAVAVMGRDLAPDDNRFADVPPPGTDDQADAGAAADADRTAPEVTVPDLDEPAEVESGPSDHTPESTPMEPESERDPFDFGFDFDEPESEPAQSAVRSGMEEAAAGDDAGARDSADQQDADPAEFRPDDLDFGDEPAGESTDEAGTTSATADSASEVSQEDSADKPADEPLDFDFSDFDFGVGDEPARPSGEPAAEAEEPSRTTSSFDLDDLDIEDMDQQGGRESDSSDWHQGESGDRTETSPFTERSDESDAEVESVDLDSGDLSLEDLGAGEIESDTEVPSGETAGADDTDKPDEQPTAADFSRPDDSDDKAQTDAPAEPAFGLIDDDAFGEQAPDEEDDDITTKLDLARAYLDMGEPDMAVSLLEEVKAEGSDAQQREADTLLARAQ